MGIRRRITAVLTGTALALSAGIVAATPASAAVPFCTTTVTVKLANGGLAAVPSASSTSLTACYLNTSRRTTEYRSVKNMQSSLNYCHGQNLERDGHYGPATQAAVLNTQRELGITEDGIFGVDTRAAMKWYGSKGCSPIANQTAPASDKTVRILHWNIAGNAMNGNRNGPIVNTVVNRVQSFDPAFVSLNEVCYSQFSEIQSGLQRAGWPTDRTNFARFTGEILDAKVCGGGKFGVAVFSKEPLGRSESTKLSPDGTRENRWLLCAPRTADLATFCSTHVTYKPETQSTQLREIRSTLDKYFSQGRTPIIAGDFNVEPTNHLLDSWYPYTSRTEKNPDRNGTYREADEKYFNNGRMTYDPKLKNADSKNPKKKIDYIFIHRTKLVDWTSVEAKVGLSGKNNLSDHLTYYVTAQVKV